MGTPDKRTLGLGLTAPSRKKTIVTETSINANNLGDRAEAGQPHGSLTVASESRKEAGSPTAEALHPKRTTRIGTWNVRTLYQTGKLSQVVREFDKYRLDLLGLCETRWTGSDKRSLQSGHTFIFSGNITDHEQGVGLLMGGKVGRSLLEWEPYGPRLLRARFNSNFTKLSVVVCYAPTEEAEEEIKNEFYEQLQAIIENIPAHDMLLVLGDMNARTGSINTNRERIMGKEGLSAYPMNDNGERMCDLCEHNGLVVGGTLFRHKDIHKVTWTSPDGNTKPQIDHIMINGKWRSSLQDVRAYRGADCASDHMLVIGIVSLKLRKTRKGQLRAKLLNSDKLREPGIRTAYSLEVRNRFNLLERDTDVEMNMDQFNKILIESGKKVLGYKCRKKEEWIRTETWKKIDERKEMKQRINSTKSERVMNRLKGKYTDLDKEVKSLAKADKKAHIDGLATKAEEAARKEDMRTLYKITGELSGKGYSCNAPVKDSSGNIISEESKRNRRWKEHFESLLNRPDPTTQPDISPAEETLDIDTDPPTLEEVKQAIKAMKNGKAGGLDGVTADMLKAEELETPRYLQGILEEVWESELIPKAWTTGLIIKIPKKGDLSDCNNWRGITLLSLTGKIMSRIIHRRLSNALDGKLRTEQAGFRAGRSCSDHIFTLRQILEQSQEFNAPVYANFVDFKKAFDSIHRDSLWKILTHYGVPEKLVRMVKMLYADFSAQVLCEGELTDPFQVKTGVKQGCVLSPFLFILGIDWIMKQTTVKGKRGIRWTLTEVLEDLDFADDIVLLASRYVDIQEKTNIMAEKAGSIGLDVNVGKTKVLRMNTKVTQPVQLYSDDLVEVEEFTYLGSLVTTNGSSDSEVKSRLAKARHAFRLLRNFWKNGNISTKTKLRIFKTNVLTTLLYGAESWKITITVLKKLEVFQRKCLRSILRIFWPNTISNTELYERTSITPLAGTICQKRWRWIGHVLRMPPMSITKIALRWTPDGKRNRGRPRETWRRSVAREMKERGWSWGFLENKAQDRQQWRAMIEALCTSGCEED